MSARPMARNSRSAIAWIDAEIAMNRPSLVPYTLRGEVVSERLPVRRGFCAGHAVGGRVRALGPR